jgi:ArsR family transcriptional regulator
MFYFKYMSMKVLLDMLGNETRREILLLLSKRPCYVSQVSQELQTGQKAIIEHLELLREAGLLETRFEKIEKGRPRKYYEISDDFILEIKISPDFFTVEKLLPRIDEEILETLPNLKSITKRLDEIAHLEGGDRIGKLKEIYEDLLEEESNITEAKKVIEYLKNQIKTEIKSEMIERELFF